MWFHITSGVSALVLAIVVGKRRDFGILEHRPHNVPFVLLGAGLLWFGWFGFNAGSALAANGLAVHALVTTHVSDLPQPCFHGWQLKNMSQDIHPWLVVQPVWWQDWLQSHLEQVLFQFGALF